MTMLGVGCDSQHRQADHGWPLTSCCIVQVSFGVHDDEERAGRMYDRAMILEKGRAAKTNFPLTDYEAEVAAYRAFCAQRCVT